MSKEFLSSNTIIDLCAKNGVNKLHKNCPIKVHRLFRTLTRLLTNSMATENCEIYENSVEINMLTAKAKLI